MPAYILTGTPGAGKTAVLRMLETRGYLVVEEAATDVIALNRYLRGPQSPPLASEIGRIVAEGTYENTAFLIRSQGYVEPTSARRISYADALDFERIHERTYRELGFRLIDVPAGPLPERAAVIERFLEGG